jgi:hypothetical protein
VGLLDRFLGKRSPRQAESFSGNLSPNARSFAVAKVALATEPLPEKPYHEAVTDFLGGPIESCSSYQGRLVALGAENRFDDGIRG